MAEEGKSEQFRACAGAVVFNDEGKVLVAERLDRKGSWQFPQGGTDGEAPDTAAAREMFEEIGLEDGKHVFKVQTIAEGLRYRVQFSSWLKANFAGQEMHFTLFHFPTPEGHTASALPPVQLQGLGGEPPEFSAVRWADWADVVDGIAEFKRGVYVRLRELAEPCIRSFLDARREKQ